MDDLLTPNLPSVPVLYTFIAILIWTAIIWGFGFYSQLHSLEYLLAWLSIPITFMAGGEGENAHTIYTLLFLVERLSASVTDL